MFIDETHNWPRDERPSRPPAPSGANRMAARLFLALALAVAFLPFSLAAAVDLIRYILAQF